MAQQEREGKMTEFVLRSIVIGVGATAVYDLWGRLLVGLFGLPGSNWAMAGRWFSHMTAGQFTHANITAAPATPYETLVGWTMHYLIGIVTITAGWLIMAPAMGFGIASAKAPNVETVRIVQLVGHCMFGLGLYWSARLTSLA